MAAEKLNAPASSIKTLKIPFLETPRNRTNQTSSTFDFFFPLPEHVFFRPGSEVVLRFATPVKRPVTLWLNRKKLAELKPGNLSPSDIHIPLSEETIRPGWNRLYARFTSGPVKESDTLNISPESTIHIAYERIPLFPELQRFPLSFSEEQILDPDFWEQPEKQKPAITILLPSKLRNIYIRACAIIGARLGQAQYLTKNSCKVKWIDRLHSIPLDSNCIVTATRDEIRGFQVPPHISKSLESLKSGEGLLAEFIAKQNNKERRILLISGADDAGLEKALLTLGSSYLVVHGAENPLVISSEPKLPGWIEDLALPLPPDTPLVSLTTEEIRLKGPSTDEKSIAWRLPYNFQLRPESHLKLIFDHSPHITKGSILEVLNNGVSMGKLPLTSKNTVSTNALPFPKNVTGFDPMQLTFRASFEGTTEIQGSTNQWIKVSNHSVLSTSTRNLELRGLEHFSRFMLQDNFMRKGVFLIPHQSNSLELQTLIQVAIHFGKMLPSSPALWPDACGYSIESPPPVDRLKDKSVLILGSASQWREALPKKNKLSIAISEYFPDFVDVQNSRAPVTDFDPSLCIAQIFPSPWSLGNHTITLGGWKTFTTPTILNCLTNPKMNSLMYGDIFFLDAKGRTYSCYLKTIGSNSLIEQMRTSITFQPQSDTSDWIWRQLDAQRLMLNARNLIVACVFLFFLTIAVWLQVVLVRDKKRRRLIQKTK